MGAQRRILDCRRGAGSCGLGKGCKPAIQSPDILPESCTRLGSVKNVVRQAGFPSEGHLRADAAEGFGA